MIYVIILMLFEKKKKKKKMKKKQKYLKAILETLRMTGYKSGFVQLQNYDIRCLGAGKIIRPM